MLFTTEQLMQSMHLKFKQLCFFIIHRKLWNLKFQLFIDLSLGEAHDVIFSYYVQGCEWKWNRLQSYPI